MKYRKLWKYCLCSKLIAGVGSILSKVTVCRKQSNFLQNALIVTLSHPYKYFKWSKRKVTEMFTWFDSFAVSTMKLQLSWKLCTEDPIIMQRCDFRPLHLTDVTINDRGRKQRCWLRWIHLDSAFGRKKKLGFVDALLRKCGLPIPREAIQD